jgi:hypothetical protein
MQGAFRIDLLSQMATRKAGWAEVSTDKEDCRMKAYAHWGDQAQLFQY